MGHELTYRWAWTLIHQEAISTRIEEIVQIGLSRWLVAVAEVKGREEKSDRVTWVSGNKLCEPLRTGHGL